MNPRASQVSKRSRLSAPVAVLVTAGVLLLLSNRYAGASLLLLLPVAWAAHMLHVLGVRWMIRGRRTEVTEAEILSRASTGGVVGRISLERPFTYEYLDRGPGVALVRLRQGRERVLFSTEEPGAERIVRDGQEWPPRERAVWDG